MNIATFIRDTGACGEYRVNLPFSAWNARDKDLTWNVINRDTTPEQLRQSLDDADIVTVPRPMDDAMLHDIELLQYKGKKVVIDVDDDLFNVSPYSDAYETFGVEDVYHALDDGSQVPLWVDGTNYDKEKNIKIHDNLKSACEISDLITVPQPILADVYKEKSTNITDEFGEVLSNKVKCLPNCVNLDVWNKLPLKRRDTIRVGWSGGSSHYEDLLMISDLLVEVMKEYPKMRLVLIGQQFAGISNKFPKNRLEIHNWCPTPAHPYRQAILDLDIALIPLVDNVFNRSKSCIKWVEASALSIPSLTSFVSPYKEVHTSKNGVFAENTPDAWYKGLKYLLDNEKERIKMGKCARHTVEQNFNINTQWKQWKQTYESLVN